MGDPLGVPTLALAPGRTYRPGVDEDALVSALCGGSEAAFALLVEEHHAAMVRVASSFVGGQAAAEDVVQDVWLIVVRGIGRFQGRSSLKTWIFRILTNRAKSAGQRERRHVPISELPASEWTGLEPAEQPKQLVLLEDVVGIVHQAIQHLPTTQRHVITLRDVEGCDAKEVCELLDLTEGNQRVLLHRARTRVRQRMRAQHPLVDHGALD